MKLTRQVTMQSLPSIRLVQENDKSLVNKINSVMVNTVPLWKNQLSIALATFPNENALVPVSDTSWTVSNASGDALYFAPGSGMAGKLTPGALEQSNVDMTSELVTLMSAQRNYQANTKVISTENEMVQTLMQAL